MKIKDKATGIIVIQDRTVLSKLNNSDNKIKDIEDWLEMQKNNTKRCKGLKTSEGHIHAIVRDNAQLNL